MVIPDHDDLWYRGLKRKSALLKGTRGSVAYVMLIFEFWGFWMYMKDLVQFQILLCSVDFKMFDF